MRLFILLIAVVMSGGCAKLAHMQELLTLKAMSDDGDRQKKFVQKQDARFALLLEKVKNSYLSGYGDKKHFLKDFGEPIFIERLEQDGRVLEQWLYRYSVKFFDSEKVYLRFDADGRLSSWEYFPAPPKSATADGNQS